MSSCRLNTREILKGVPAGRNGPPGAQADEGPTPDGPQLTRREALRFAGAAAAAAYAAPAAAGLSPLPAPIVGRTGGVVWLRAGGHAAFIDPNRFGGSPSLTVSSKSPWRARLSGATFPGTSLSADMELAVMGSGPATRLSVRMSLGGFKADVPLSLWLAGKREARSAVRLEDTRVELGTNALLTLDGPAVASLSAQDWTLSLRGAGIARLDLDGSRIVADSVRISLAPADGASLLNRKLKRRAEIEIRRGGSAWSLGAVQSSSGSVAFAIDGFDRATIECAQTAGGAPHRAVLFEPSAEGGSGAYTAAGSSASVPLSAIRYARLLDDGSYFVAGRYADCPTWLHMGGTALIVSDAEWAPAFEMRGISSDARIVCNPALLGVAAPLGDVISAPLAFPETAKSVASFGNTASRKMTAFALANPNLVTLPPVIDPGSIVIPPVVMPDQTSVTITRPDDLLTLTFEFFNLSYRSGSPSKLVRTSTQRPAYVSVTFPPQNMVERAYYEDQEPLENPPIQSFIAEPSRLAFRIPDATADAGIPFTVEGLLDWTGYTHSIVPAAERGKQAEDLKDTMRLPSAGDHDKHTAPETSLEVPWGLYMSPSANEHWEHSSTPVTKASRTELWHTQMHGEPISIFGMVAAPPPGGIGGTPGPLVGEADPTLRAVWARYYDWRLKSMMPSVTLKRNSMTSGGYDPSAPSWRQAGLNNRWAIVDLTGRFHEDPIRMRRLWLSPLGAWFDGRGAWDETVLTTKDIFGAQLEEWDHRATMGRDHYVKIVEAGRIFPFGHKASVITITERKFRYSPDKTRRYAYLLKREYVKIKEPVKTYDYGDTARDRQLPFKKIEMKTVMTPPITRRKIDSTIETAKAFWPRTAATNTDSRFQFEATDWDGSVVRFNTPIVFVALNCSVGMVSPDGQADEVVDKSNSVFSTVSVDMAGQNIAYAEKPGTGTDQGDERTHPTTSMYFDAEVVSPSINENRFYCRMLKSNIRLDTVEQMTGSSAPTAIKISGLYKDLGWTGDNAAGKVFAELLTGLTPSFPGELAGGLALPIPKFTGISAIKGAVGGGAPGGDIAEGLKTIASGQFNPADFFTDLLDSTLLGGIKLKDLLGSLPIDFNQMPTFKQFPDPEIPDEIVITYEWSTRLSKSVLVFVPDPTDCTLELKAEIRKKLKDDPLSPPTYTTTASLKKFKLLMVPAFESIELTFTSLDFESKNGGAPDVKPNITDVQFIGEMKYLAELAKYCGALSGGAGSTSLVKADSVRDQTVHAQLTVVDSGPLKIDVDAKGITASLDIALPDIAIGAFSLKNMSFGAVMKISFGGDPVTLDFNFCRRESPFELLVMCYGGGGYVLLGFASTDLVILEISLEFGAGTSFSIGGIASGMVEIKGGLTVRYESLPAPKTTLIVFIRIHGSLEVLGIITVSVTFYLELKYETLKGGDGNKLSGTATLTIEIEILFFSTSVELSVTKELAGKDPRFGELIQTQGEWDSYCMAFAPASLGA